MFLAQLALKSTVVLTAAWMITVLLRGRSSAVRHLVWTAASAAVLVLPLLSVSLPALRLPVAGSEAPALFRVSAVARIPAEQPSAQRLAKPAEPPQSGAIPIDWAVAAQLIWGAGSLLALARMLAAWMGVEKLRRNALPSADQESCGMLSKALEVRQRVDLLETKAGSMPMTFGVLRSAILLPSDASGWTEERRRVVLLHELAHVRRGDVATQLLARMALIVYWWNPMAWLAWHRSVKERECAADDLVLNAGTSASAYARHLLEVARGMQLSPASGWAAVPMVRRSQLETRLRAILDSGVNRKAPGRAGALAAAVLALLLIAPLAAVRAQDVRVVAVPADVEAAIRAARSQKNYQILEDSAKAAVESLQYDSAEKLLTAAVAIRAEVSGNPSRDYGLGLLNLAELQQRRHESESAAASWASGAQILGDDPKAAGALLHLGTAALIKKSYSLAAGYFQHAQQIDAASAGMALMWSAVTMEAQKNAVEADALFRRAVAQEDPAAPDAATILRVYGHFLQSQGREEEASALEARIPATASKPAELPAGVYRMGGGIQAPKVLEKIEPEYSDEARAAKLSGTAVLMVQIGPDGRAHNVKVVRGLGLGLDECGVDAISRWRFQPGQKDGQPVAVLATIEIHFRLL